MIIDVHGHVSAPDALHAYKANVLSHRGAHGRGRVTATVIHNAAALFGLKGLRATHSQETV